MIADKLPSSIALASITNYFNALEFRDLSETSQTLALNAIYLVLHDALPICATIGKLQRDIVSVTINILDRYSLNAEGSSIIDNRKEYQLASIVAVPQIGRGTATII